jgi:hypothetical protein
MKTLLGIVLVLVSAGAALAAIQTPFQGGAQAPASKAAAPARTDADIVRAQKPAYPLDTCVVSGKKLDAQAVDHVVEGRLVRLCCANCKDGAAKAAATWTKRLDDAVIAAQKPAYPLSTCPISGEKLGAKGEPVDVVHDNKLVRLCCSGCTKPFRGDPAAAMQKVDKAWIDAQLATYPLETCPVSDEKLGSMGEPLNVLYGTKLVRLCCSGCR